MDDLFQPRRLRTLALLVGLTALVGGAADAATTLTVDLSMPIRDVTHAASGSLYGVTETLPADVNGLIAPLHPYVFNNPRKQQSGLDNFYGYEIWNEPQGTYASTNPLSFNQFWQQTYAKLRSLDPGPAAPRPVAPEPAGGLAPARRAARAALRPRPGPAVVVRARPPARARRPSVC
jgi:hypothetical protein